jgi:hypothetical protein
MNSGNAEEGKGPQFKTDATSSEEREIGFRLRAAPISSASRTRVSRFLNRAGRAGTRWWVRMKFRRMREAARHNRRGQKPEAALQIAPELFELIRGLTFHVKWQVRVRSSYRLVTLPVVCHGARCSVADPQVAWWSDSCRVSSTVWASKLH